MTHSCSSNLLKILGFGSDGAEDPIQQPALRDARDAASPDNDIIGYGSGGGRRVTGVG